jgi:hypothetical protein
MRRIGNHYSSDGTARDAGRGCLYTLVLAGGGEGPEERLLAGLLAGWGADSAALIKASAIANARVASELTSRRWEPLSRQER